MLVVWTISGTVGGKKALFRFLECFTTFQNKMLKYLNLLLLLLLLYTRQFFVEPLWDPYTNPFQNFHQQGPRQSWKGQISSQSE